MSNAGLFRRIADEYKYFTMKKWSFEQCGDFWNTVKDYDTIDDETYAYKRRFYDSVAMVGMLRKGRVLDIDCRSGNGSLFYHQKGFIESVVCVTPSTFFQSLAMERLKEANANVEEFILLRKLPLPLKSGSFDTVLFFETMEHISHDQRQEFVNELYRVLEPGGTMIMSMPNVLWEPVHWFAAITKLHHSEGPHRFLRDGHARRLLKNAGFTVQKSMTTVFIPAGPAWITGFGAKLEKMMQNNLMKLIGLRRIYICRCGSRRIVNSQVSAS